MDRGFVADNAAGLQRLRTVLRGLTREQTAPPIPGGWTVAAPGDSDLEVVLQPADWFQGEARRALEAMVGHNPTLVLRVDDCAATCAELKARGVTVAREPERLTFGVQAIIQDFYGNDLVLLQP